MEFWKVGSRKYYAVRSDELLSPPYGEQEEEDEWEDEDCVVVATSRERAHHRPVASATKPATAVREYEEGRARSRSPSRRPWNTMVSRNSERAFSPGPPTSHEFLGGLLQLTEFLRPTNPML